ncbi:MAG: NnrS family protein [Turneriella sp.]|nr:NnrS family protein [Turneriella sp.]
MDRIPLFATAFRIFFLACAAHAAVVIPLWVLKLNGHDFAPTEVSPLVWHSYEMVFGFCRAAIFGFLFTAGQHWSGKFLLGGNSLFLLFILWLVGRFAFFLPPALSVAALALDTIANLFAAYRLRHLLDPQRKHNHSVVYLFFVYALTQMIAALMAVRTELSWHYMHVVRLGLIEVIVFIIIIAGRILPFFASVVLPEMKPRILPRLEKWIVPVGFISLALFAASPYFPHGEKYAALSFLVTAVLHAVRWFFWHPAATFRVPILAVLYIGYFWLIAGFILLAIAGVGWIPLSPAWHMLAIGAGGIFIFGMMTRVALGHTGRAIKASPAVVVSYFALGIALLLRVVLPLAGLYHEAYAYAAAFWFAAFALYVVEYGPILSRRRIDGKPG